MSLAEQSINDVGPGVSRRHARIWKDAAGSWWIEGLGSTNGTALVRRGETVVVEPPRSERAADAGSQPVGISAEDVLVLAGTTEFAVVEVL